MNTSTSARKELKKLVPKGSTIHYGGDCRRGGTWAYLTMPLGWKPLLETGWIQNPNSRCYWTSAWGQTKEESLAKILIYVIRGAQGTSIEEHLDEE